MFEKEAKEYTHTKHCEKCFAGHCEKKCFLVKDDFETFKDGAEFGYNKAKEEWKKHFMQCSSPFCLDIFSSVKCYGELGNMAKKEGEEK